WLLYEGHPYRHPVLGLAAGLRAATLEDVKKHAAAVFTAERLTVGLAGAADAKLEARARADFAAGLPSHGRAPVKVPVAAAPAGRRVLVVDKPDAKSTAISLGFPLPVTRADDDFAALALVASYFGEHRQFHGVLFKSLREARGLNYGDYAYVESFIQEGYERFPRAGTSRSEQLFTIWIRPVPNDKAMFALRGALYYLQKLVDEGMTKEAFERTRGFLSGYSFLMEQTEMRRLGYLIDDRFYGLGAPHLERMRAAWAKMTVDDVNAVIKKYLGYKDIDIAVVTAGGAAFKDALVAGAPSPIKYDTKKPAAVLKEDTSIIAYPLGLTADRVEVVPVDAVFEK
ncbi:MAG TPA: insulinase family protein, partial [Myxococcota bacterium]|nr:insulinase family protein [Myxococcota bacterium]